jgi:hypothetical protein
VDYRADVEFLDECQPGLVGRNAAEFARMRDLLGSVTVSGPLAEVVTALAGVFGDASQALKDYADGLAEAKREFEAGVDAEDALDKVISAEATAVTRAAQEAEPLRRWEELQAGEGFFGWLAGLGADVEGIRAEAARAYDQAGAAFGRARAAEETARTRCLAGLDAAQRALPTLPSGSVGVLDEVIQRAASIADHPLLSLPGSGPKGEAFPNTTGDVVSPVLRELRAKIASLPELAMPWLFTVAGATENDRLAWLTSGRAIIRAAAADAGLPVVFLAGIAWKEVGRKPTALDEITDGLRSAAAGEWSPVAPENLPGPLGGDRDHTSYGPLSVQTRRAAEVLGYDPATLTTEQRDEIHAALKDATQNIFIAAKHLADLKAMTAFATTSAEELTPEHYRELAARYNGGPYWRGPQAQAYARDVESNLDAAKAAVN